jgi:hypothetical protein
MPVVDVKKSSVELGNIPNTPVEIYQCASVTMRRMVPAGAKQIRIFQTRDCRPERNLRSPSVAFRSIL